MLRFILLGDLAQEIHIVVLSGGEAMTCCAHDGAMSRTTVPLVAPGRTPSLDTVSDELLILDSKLFFFNAILARYTASRWYTGSSFRAASVAWVRLQQCNTISSSILLWSRSCRYEFSGIRIIADNKSRPFLGKGQLSMVILLMRSNAEALIS